MSEVYNNSIVPVTSDESTNNVTKSKENNSIGSLTKILFVLCISAFLWGLLSGCSSSPNEISIIPNEASPTLNLQLPEPIALEKNYNWKVFKDNSNEDIILGLTKEDYESYQRNMETIQSRLDLVMEYLNQYKLFYEKERYGITP